MRLVRHIRANVVGYVALFFALSAGAYASALAPDSVGTKQIVDGQVRMRDVAVDSGPGALTGQNIANDSLDGYDIHGLSRADVQDDTLTGNQILESSLGKVPWAAEAAQGGTGYYSDSGACNPGGNNFVSCSTVQVTHANYGRFLVIAQLLGQDQSGDGPAGLCHIEVNEQPIAGSETFLMPQGYGTENATLIAVTNLLPSGSQWVGVACNDRDGGFNVTRARVAAVTLAYS